MMITYALNGGRKTLIEELQYFLKKKMSNSWIIKDA